VPVISGDLAVEKFLDPRPPSLKAQAWLLDSALLGIQLGGTEAVVLDPQQAYARVPSDLG